MNKFVLKNKQEAEISFLDFKDIEVFCSQDLPIQDMPGTQTVVFKGFSYVRPSLPYYLKHVGSDKEYFLETDLSPLEVQAQKNLKRVDYHKAITASLDDSLLGMLLCQWTKSGWDFWHYHIRFVDIHNDYKNQGIGTKLIQELDKAEFIKGKILLIGMLSEQGRDYMRNVVKRELKGKDYALVFEDYLGDTPTSFGVYGGEHWY